jgi:hypothetical protein
MKIFNVRVILARQDLFFLKLEDQIAMAPTGREGI